MSASIDIPETVIAYTAGRWEIYRREDVERLLTALLPYLRIKKQQALIVLEFLTIPKASRWSDPSRTLERKAELRLKLNELNQRGRKEENNEN